MGMMLRGRGEAKPLVLNPHVAEPAALPAGTDTERQGPACYSNKPRAVFHLIVDLTRHLKKPLTTGEGKTQKPSVTILKLSAI